MKPTNPNRALIRILANDQEPRRPIGAGTLISERHIITCAHVVQQVVKTHQEQVFLDFPLLSSDQIMTGAISCLFPYKAQPRVGEPEDICILEIATSNPPENAQPASFIKMKEIAVFDRPVRVCGFPASMQGGADGDWADGKLKGLNARGQIQLDHHLDSKTIAPGFSGSAVWDKKRGVAIGMIVSKDTREGKTSGYMVPTATLARAWPSIIPTRTGKRHHHEFNIFMCDRGNEAFMFLEQFMESYQRQPHRHQVYIIPGDRNACHQSLIRRLQATHVKDFIHREYEKACYPDCHTVIWPNKSPIELRKKRLAANLFNTFDPNYLGPDYSAEAFKNLCLRLNLREKPIVMLDHPISTSPWDCSNVDLMHWYFTEYWNAFEGGGDLPLFLIFFSIRFPVYAWVNWMAALFWRIMMKRLILKRIARGSQTDDADCGCFLFDRLKPVSDDDVSDWFSQCKFDLLEKEKQERIHALFRKRRRLAMAEIEPFLRALIQEIDAKHANLQPDA